jgi:hypothetical protein
VDALYGHGVETGSDKSAALLDFEIEFFTLVTHRLTTWVGWNIEGFSKIKGEQPVRLLADRDGLGPVGR